MPNSSGTQASAETQSQTAHVAHPANSAPSLAQIPVPTRHPASSRLPQSHAPIFYFATRAANLLQIPAAPDPTKALPQHTNPAAKSSTARGAHQETSRSPPQSRP